MKYKPYSFSKIYSYDRCPKSFYLRYIKKIKTAINFFPLEKGSLWHSLIELKLKNSIDTYKKRDFKAIDNKEYQRQLKNIIEFMKSDIFQQYYNSDSEKIVEARFSINDDGEVRIGKYPDELLNGKIDFININENYIDIIDWKTGGKSKEHLKRYPPEKFQLEIYEYVVSKLYNPKQINSKFCFVEHPFEYEINTDNVDIWQKIKNKIDIIENDTEFKKNVTKLCDWCDFTDRCLH